MDGPWTAPAPEKRPRPPQPTTPAGTPPATPATAQPADGHKAAAIGSGGGQERAGGRHLGNWQHSSKPDGIPASAMVQDESLQQPDGMHYGRQQSSSQPYKSSGKQRPPHHAEPSAQTPMKPAALCASASGSAPPGPASELSPQELGAKIAAAMLARIFGAAERPESSVRRPSLAHGNKMHGPTPRDTHNSPQLVTNPPAKPAESDTKGAGMCSQSDTRPHAAWETRGHTAGQTQQQQQSKHVEAPPASQSKQSNGRGNDLENGLHRGDGQIAAAGAGWTMALHPDAVQPYKPDAITRRQIAAIQVAEQVAEMLLQEALSSSSAELYLICDSICEQLCQGEITAA
ncbi:hypothetical protein WJX84_007748 [Apatococcus fuscideae]|uniref:Uncharacterized protein n=1 Tax=Apatococcus fuscideae TaxID=2026836 RepID=A0AAW1T1A4_9CHLO